ncbi:ABC transporter ATP-binding protein [Alloiococcus sp. CFN-8]|uniref:ABC transporter ATP-binding protein n=1 Tax=Alloiococcus sp. CFN-8 TaxID=3416081 RepID=UPI003CF1F904
MKRIFSYLRPYSLGIALGLSIKFFGTIMDLVLPWILSYMIDSVVPLRSVPKILLWGGIMLLASITALVANIIANRMAASVTRDTLRRIRHDLFEKITSLSSKQIDEISIPSLVSRLTSDTYNIHQLIGMMQRIGIRAPILLLGGIIITLTLDPVLTLVLLSIIPFITIAVYIISKRGIPLYTRLQKSVDSMVRVVRENITGIRVIKALSKTDYEKARFHKANEEVVDSEKRAGINMATSSPLMNLFLNVGLVLVIITGAYRVNNGLSTPGKIIAFLSYFTIILNAMLIITRIFVVMSKGFASGNRITEILELKEDMNIEEIPKVQEDYHIVFDGVSFSYNNNEDNLTDINFKIKKGETLGIIGPTGSGKTTIIQLLMRFYDVNKGSIRINGRDIRSIPWEILHTMFGVVLQNDILFRDTIGENISFGRNLTEEQLKDSIKHAQAEEFISSIDEGFNYRVASKGANLSGGQKQRLLIARALANSPEILILDDSSSALDYKTDASLRASLRDNFKETTSIIIAQRVSSIMHADHIIVLEDGNILASGTHEELMSSSDIYKEISRMQLGGEING